MPLTLDFTLRFLNDRLFRLGTEVAEERRLLAEHSATTPTRYMLRDHNERTDLQVGRIAKMSSEIEYLNALIERLTAAAAAEAREVDITKPRNTK